MTVVLLLVVQRVLFVLVAVAVVLLLFTALQFNLRGAELMACLVLRCRQMVHRFCGASPRGSVVPSE